jgi:hypothetical protein
MPILSSMFLPVPAANYVCPLLLCILTCWKVPQHTWVRISITLNGDSWKRSSIA